jgi:hypothetical protein
MGAPPRSLSDTALRPPHDPLIWSEKITAEEDRAKRPHRYVRGKNLRLESSGANLCADGVILPNHYLACPLPRRYLGLKTGSCAVVPHVDSVPSSKENSRPHLGGWWKSPEPKAQARDGALNRGSYQRNVKRRAAAVDTTRRCFGNGYSSAEVCSTIMRPAAIREPGGSSGPFRPARSRPEPAPAERTGSGQASVTRTRPAACTCDSSPAEALGGTDSGGGPTGCRRRPKAQGVTGGEHQDANEG